MLSRRKRRQKLALKVFAVLVVLAGLAAPLAYANRQNLIRNPLVRQLVPLYRSFLKLPDLFFLPRYAFFNSDLETYQLTIDPKNIRKLDQALPGPFAEGELGDDNKVWVKADFKALGYQDQVKVRYRGNIANHWNSYKKSFLIKFPKDHLFQGKREINLVIPDDRAYFVEPLNNYRAKKLGLIVPESYNIRLSLNGSDHGVYLAFEHWTQEWLEKRPISASSIIWGIGQPLPGVATSSSVFTPDGAQYWKSWNKTTPDLDSVRALTEIISKADDETFKKLLPHLVSLDEMLALNVVNTLSGTFHGAGDSPGGANNTVMIFDGLIGKFRPVPYNIDVADPETSYQEIPSSLERRILAIPEWHEARNKLLKDYLAKNNADDLRFIDAWIKKYNSDFLSDEAKLGNNFSYLKEISRLQRVVKFFQTEAPKHLADQYPPVPRLTGNINLPASFAGLWGVIKTPEDFSLEHPEFTLGDDGLILASGTHYFPKTVIIPAQTKLTILPGAVLAFGSRASLISYSPIWAMGTSDLPIKMIGAGQPEAWGTVAVIDAGRQKSIFDHVFMSGGSGAIVNEILISGMLALHGSNLDLSNSYLTKANSINNGDDTLNLKAGLGLITGNIFIDNSSDSIDLDLVDPKTVVSGNRFVNSGTDSAAGGDGLDISGSDILIKDNIMIGNGDKGISVGEKSNPTIVGNLIAKNNIGIAIKDSSKAKIDNNIIIKNKTGLAAYEKKTFFGGGQGTVTNGVIWGNETETEIDKMSKIDFDKVSHSEPNLNNWPLAIQALLK